MNIYVGNLSYSVTQKKLEDIFSEFGKVKSVKVVTDQFTGKSKGFAFVEMENDGEAEQAIEALNNKDVEGRNLKVNKARPREAGARQERPPRRY